MALHVLFVGVGSIGSRHMRNLLELVPDTQVSVLHSSKRELYDIEKHATVHHDLDEALAAKPDAVFICNPTGQHIPIARAAAKAGCAIFIEKPLSASDDGVAELIEECNAHNTTTFVAYCLRFHPDLKKIKELIMSGAIGKPLSATICCGSYFPDWNKNRDYKEDYRVSKERGGGVLLDLSHEIDYACWLFGKPTSVIATTGNVSSLEMDAEDSADLIVDFEGGICVSIHLDYFQKPDRRFCEIRGSEGTLSWVLQQATIRLYRNGKWEIIDCAPLREGKDMYIEELSHFLACQKDGSQTAIPLKEGACTLNVILAAKQSSESGQRVDIQ